MVTSMAKMNVNPHSKFIKIVMGYVQHYNPDKYWRRRAIVIDPNNKTPKIIKLFYLYYIKKCDAFNNASLGTDINQGAIFESQPDLAHGLNGIIVHLRAHIGKMQLFGSKLQSEVQVEEHLTLEIIVKLVPVLKFLVV